MNDEKLSFLLLLTKNIKVLLVLSLLILFVYDSFDGSEFSLLNFDFIDSFFSQLSISTVEILAIFIGMILFYNYRPIFLNTFRGPIFSICALANFILLGLFVLEKNVSFSDLY